MGSPELSTRSPLLNNHNISARHAKIVKKRRALKPRKLLQSKLKARNGLLKTAITDQSDLMQIAKRNSLQSPLLRLPGEIRNKIWEYAVGYHQVDIHDYSPVRRWDIRLTHVTRALESGPTPSRSFVSPTFSVPKVCRQMYVETSAMVYTLNNFGFDSLDTFDRWILNRAPGQKVLVASVDVPFGYYNLYKDGFRKLFRRTFPNLKRVRLHSQMALLSQRVVASTWLQTIPIMEPLEATKKRFVEAVKEKEGEDIGVGWYKITTSPLAYLHY